jgi:hypothetical protein
MSHFSGIGFDTALGNSHRLSVEKCPGFLGIESSKRLPAKRLFLQFSQRQILFRRSTDETFVSSFTKSRIFKGKGNSDE